MRSIVKWAIKNSPAMNTILIASLIVGVISMIILRREVFPAFGLEIVVINVPFPGATPEEVEEGICQKIESAVANVESVKKMTSIANEGNGFVLLELNSNIKDVQKVLNEVRSEIQQIEAFLPPRAEDAEVKQVIFRKAAISVGIIGPELSDSAPRDGPVALARERQLRQLAEDIRLDLLNLSPVPPKNAIRRFFAPLFQPKGLAISSAEIAGAKPYEVAIEISEDKLREFEISLQQFSQVVRKQNVNVPGGKMETANQELLLRGDNKREVGAGIAELPVITRPSGDVVTVGELATVIDGFAETTAINLINGREGLVIEVSKTNEEDLFTVVEAVKDYVASKEMPHGYQISTWGDISSDVKDRIDLLARNGLQGLLLVFVVLAVFLDLRLAFWVAMGIPISILGAGFILLAFDQTLNMLSMFAFLMALGIVVDDAIVVGENIYLKREEGLPYVKAAIEGTVEVLPSVAASVSTTIIAFMPLFYVVGVMGKFISIMPLAVIAMLVISLLESTFVLPAHLAHEDNLLTKTLGLVFYVFKPLVRVHGWVNRKATAGLEFVINKLYQPLLYMALNFKVVVVALILCTMILLVGVWNGGFIAVGFFPKLDGRQINATLAFPNGTAGDFSSDATAMLRDAILEIDSEIQRTATLNFPDGHPSVIDNLYEKVGESGDALGPTGLSYGSHVATVAVLLTSPSDRDITVRQLIARWREAVPKISGTEALKFDAESMGPGGAAVEFKILSDDKSVSYIEQAVEEAKAYLSTQVGVTDIEDDSRPGKWELSLRLTEEGQASGLDEAAVAETIRAAYFGDEVMRLQRGRHEVKLMVRYPRESRISMEGLNNLRIRDTATGVERPLVEIAEVSFKRKVAEINRLNQRRSITVTADVEKTQGSASAIIAEMQRTFVPNLIERYKNKYGANLTVDWEGQQQQTQESITSMMTGFGVALLCMYVLLTLEFRSYLQPLIIMAIIPFAWAGAALGHSILNMEITLFSMFGMIALTGVVVNDSIVLVDFINSRVRGGMPLFEALMSAGKRRFRPILLTSMTTIAGLFPMLLETSLQAQVLIPMAVSIIFGLLFGTLLILILVPVFYDIYAQGLALMGIQLGREEDVEESDEDVQAPSQGSVDAKPAIV